MNEQFIMITGRTKAQGAGLHLGRDSDAYRQATALVQMNAEDMAKLGLEAGRTVCVRTAAGQVELPVEVSDLPPGMIFLPMGPTANLLVAADTDGSGMPAFKGIPAQVEAA